MQPVAGTYLLVTTGFSLKEEPFLTLQQNETFLDFSPQNSPLTLTFDMTLRKCTGWRDIATGERFACPDNQTLEGKYEQCQACQNRTGFNPAFYHAATVSPQQEERNSKPHILYLAYFGPGIIKVGISYAARQNSRLLEQGARSAIILETFPTAHIARQYEAKIAQLPNIAETIQLQKKIHALERPYSDTEAEVELMAMHHKIETALNVRLEGKRVLHFTNKYFPGGTPKLNEAHDMSKDHIITGTYIGMVGSLLFCDYQSTPLLLPLKKYIGHPVTLGYSEIPITLPAQQTSLF